jgi:hypothetical protein
MAAEKQGSITYQPTDATYFDLINETLEFTPDELNMLARNGFMVSDRLTFTQFKRAYAYIYWKDLPVLVTTDSILHAIHQTYDKLFQRVEIDILSPMLLEVLAAAQERIAALAGESTSDREAGIYADLDIYLHVAMALLGVKRRRAMPPNVSRFVNPIHKLNGEMALYREVSSDNTGPGIEVIRLFGLERKIDFSQFRARGHYDKISALTAYFTAMMWLSLLDFRFVEFDPDGTAQVNVEQIVAAHILRDVIDAAGQRQNWDTIDTILQAFIGWSDNITLNGLDRFIADAGVDSPSEWLKMNADKILHLLTNSDYGHQAISGQIREVRQDNDSPLPNAINLALFGQRFTVESWVMEQLVFDKLVVNGQKVKRAFPSSLDVMYTLGNDRAADHLAVELDQYRYKANLDVLRQQVNSYSHEFWQNSFYNLWLNCIRALNIEPEGDHKPQAMRSPAWMDKILHTQLASWAQLRHDHILYAKPPYCPGAICEYPGGYVEPYPAFYAAVGEYARFGKALFASVEIGDTGRTSEQTYQTTLDYFDNLNTVATRLEDLSREELAGEPFSEEDVLFLRSVVVRKHVGKTHYGGYTEEHWDGWYNSLLPFNDDQYSDILPLNDVTPELVADLHTNLDGNLGPIGVLHIGTGLPVVEVMLVEGNGGQQTAYVGPAFTYYEHLEEGSPPKRLQDEEWYRLRRPPSRYMIEIAQERLESQGLSEKERQRVEKRLQQEKARYEREINRKRPQAPLWTGSFRLSPSSERISLELPKKHETQ